MPQKFPQQIFTFLKIELAAHIIVFIFFFLWAVIAPESRYFFGSVWFGKLDQAFGYIMAFCLLIFLTLVCTYAYFSFFSSKQVKIENKHYLNFYLGTRLVFLLTIICTPVLMFLRPRYAILDIIFLILNASPFIGISYIIYLIYQIKNTQKKLCEIKKSTKE